MVDIPLSEKLQLPGQFRMCHVVRRIVLQQHGLVSDLVFDFPIRFGYAQQFSINAFSKSAVYDPAADSDNLRRITSHLNQVIRLEWTVLLNDETSNNAPLFRDSTVARAEKLGEAPYESI